MRIPRICRRLSSLFLSTTACLAGAAPTQNDGRVLQEAAADTDVLRVLTIDRPGMDLMGMERNAEAYYNKTGIKVVYERVAGLFEAHEEIRMQAQNRLPLYDGYICNPFIVGGAVQYQGWMDLTEIVRTREDLEWQDMLPPMRENLAVYDNKVFMLPLDGDAHFLFYREDVLNAFNLSIPRTWDEYWKVAQATHGQEFNGEILSGSCVGRVPKQHNSFWANLVISSYTQTRGPSQGHLFDPNDMEPLTGEAMVEALKMLELQAMYGHPKEFEMRGGGGETSLNVMAMRNGTCAITYNWGDNYKASQHPLSKVKDTMKVARTPGSTRVYNRETKKLDQCTKELCGGDAGVYYDDIGWVNRAAYLAFGGWSAAVNNNIDDSRKQKIVDFFIYMNSPSISIETTILPPDTPAAHVTNADPFRRSHLETSEWVKRGYNETSTTSYLSTVKQTFQSPNTAVDLRFAGAGRIGATLDEQTYAYLYKAVVEGSLPENEAERHMERVKVVDALTTMFREIIAAENSKPETVIPVLQQYQMDLGLYKHPIDNRDIGNIRAVGWALAVLIIASSVGFAVWVVVKRNSRVVKGSQPFFLFLICAGTTIMSGAIFPLGMDDDYFDKVGSDCPECDTACKTWPWLLFIGFTVVFSAIFSKLWRLNKLIDNAKRCAKVKVETSDVLLPFGVLLSLNVILLSIWTAIDPLVWQRIPAGEFSSYGTCKPENGTPAIVLGVLLGVVNVGALLLAEIEAYRARNISDHLSESKYIGLATVSMFQMFIIGIPVIFLVRDQPEAQYFVYSGIMFVICMAVLLLIFVPKIQFDRHPPPRASVRGSGIGLIVKMPRYATSYADNGEADDEFALELQRLRNSVKEYKFMFLELKKEVESKGLMEVETFLAEKRKEYQQVGGLSKSTASVYGNNKSSRMFGVWSDTSSACFRPPEVQHNTEQPGATEKITTFEERGSTSTQNEPATKSAEVKETLETGKNATPGCGESQNEFFSEFEATTGAVSDTEKGPLSDPEKGKMPALDEEEADESEQR